MKTLFLKRLLSRRMGGESKRDQQMNPSDLSPSSPTLKKQHGVTEGMLHLKSDIQVSVSALCFNSCVILRKLL